MKLDLLFENDKVVKLDFERIEKKIRDFNDFLKSNKNYQDSIVADRYLETNSTNKKNIGIKIFSLINDLKYDINFREMYNIISKNNPNDQTEQDIVNLFEGLSIFLESKKIIHQGNVFMLYNVINQTKNRSFQNLSFRKNNFGEKNKNIFKIVDYNKVPLLFDQLVNFINSKNNFEPWINMQIVHIHNLAISPFEDKNILFSKILSVWYWLTYASEVKEIAFPIETYLEVLKLNSEEYLAVVKRCLKNGDYTDFIDFIIENITSYQEKKILTTRINRFLRQKYKVYLAEYEKNFLFVIIYYQMNEFDWKLFKKITKWVCSKQYIIRHLTKFVCYSLLFSRSFKNRKFFYQSRLLKKIIASLEVKNTFRENQ